MDWLREHSLSITVIGIWLLLVLLSMWHYDGSWGEWFSDRSGGHADDAFGALLVILLTKWFRERGSAQSN